MMPEKKKMLIVGVIAMIALMVLVLVVYLITRIARGSEVLSTIVSDNYPSEVVYLGVYYDEENDHDIIYPLNEDLERLDYSLNSFYPIKDYHVVNNRLIIYSDTVNEIAYNQEENRFFLNEMNPYFNRNANVKLTNEYLLFIENGKITARPYTSDNNENDFIITDDLTGDYVETFENIVYFTTSNGIEGYDLSTSTSEVIVEARTEELFTPVLKEATETLFLLDVDGVEWLYSTISKELITLKDSIKDSYSNVSLYEDGLIYYLEESEFLMSKDFSRGNINGFITFKNTLDTVNYITGQYLYMEQTTPEQEKLYLIYDAKNMNIIATLEYPYTYIARVGK